MTFGYFPKRYFNIFSKQNIVIVLKQRVNAYIKNMIFIIIILGLVQGIMEFLPVSSSGHILVVYRLFGLDIDLLGLNIILHIATALSVVVVYRKKLFYMLTHPFSKEALDLIFATVVSCIIILLIHPFLKDAIGGKFLSVSFVITAIFLIITTIINKKYTFTSPLDKKTILVMSVFQAISVLPGLSRSGLTLCSGLICGKNKSEVADFSFLMGLPLIVAGGLYDFIFEKPNFSNVSVWALVLGFIVAFVSGIFAILLTKKLAEKTKLWYFSIYLVVLAIISVFVL